MIDKRCVCGEVCCVCHFLFCIDAVVFVLFLLFIVLKMHINIPDNIFKYCMLHTTSNGKLELAHMTHVILN